VCFDELGSKEAKDNEKDGRCLLDEWHHTTPTGKHKGLDSINPASIIQSAEDILVEIYDCSADLQLPGSSLSMFPIPRRASLFSDSSLK
jgi:hypothetical protein